MLHNDLDPDAVLTGVPCYAAYECGVPLVSTQNRWSLSPELN